MANPVYIDVLNLQGFTLIDGNPLPNVAFDNTIVKVVLNANCTVINPPVLNVTYDNGGGVDTAQFNFIFNTSSNTYDAYPGSMAFIDNAIISADIEGLALENVQPIITDYPILSCYKIDSSMMSRISTIRFQQLSSGDYSDLAKYILSLVRYPFDVITSNTSNIQLGYYQTQIQAPLVLSQTYSVDLGVVNVRGLEGDSSDISQSVIDLILPFVGVHSIDSKYINTSIHVSYLVDVLSNSCVVYIYSDNVLIDTIDCSIGFDIPYILKVSVDDTNLYNLNFSSSSLKNLTPKIIVKQKAKVNDSFNDTFISVDDLNNLSDFIKCIDYEISEIPTNEETNLINKEMQNGVII